MAGYWLKLYTEILDDPKYHRLSNGGRLGLMELMLVVKRYGDDEGLLPSVEDLAFYTRRDVTWWKPVIEELKGIQFIVDEDGRGKIRKWSERQAAISSTERSRYYREKRFTDMYKSDEETERPGDDDATNCDSNENTPCNDEATNRFTSETNEKRSVTKIKIKKQNRLREEEEEEGRLTPAPPPPPSFSVTQGPIPYLEIYSQVTGQVAIPGGELEKVLPALEGLLSQHKTPKAVIAFLRPYYRHWISQRTKDGRPYPRHKCVWLYDWAVSGMPLDGLLDTSIKPKTIKKADPNCKKCEGLGMVASNKKVGEAGFGVLQPCTCLKEVQA